MCFYCKQKNCRFPDPIDAIKVKMEELGLKNKDLIGKVWSKSYVSMILNRKKPLTLDLARLFQKEQTLSVGLLLSYIQALKGLKTLLKALDKWPFFWKITASAKS
jgi:hypothetical protein